MFVLELRLVINFLSSHGRLLLSTHDFQNLFIASFILKTKNKTDPILPKVGQGSTKKALNGAFLDEKLI